ncbi:virulence factor [Marinivivus vitaminiproducens]|uniref:virulence factor n=1 Tax=Marinivivus vitaminiproducens TaxID=3035935 RepID=UPI00279B2320|nr:hypothetical protein P4R82_23630 [Geminicoccaceae bacterium SCSIO 64248]
MYAICFDLDTAEAGRTHPSNDPTAAYKTIERVLKQHGFNRTQGSVFFGTNDTGPVECVLAVQDLVKRHPAMKFIIRDIRMLRVEENNDLIPALGRQADLPFDDANEG